ncbi:MAG: 50S ribosomal protein L2 [Capsulimonas sp.]|jgi:large subunit ribosomal protein L2|uniref:50S ribosomal protein L2 n=1 Tax=Capsulimonas sp. TaxID=2494211 RepID=UPI003263C8A3
MAVKRYKPITPGQRFRVGASYDEITATKPLKALTGPNKHSGGRNNKGRRTAVNVGGGNKTAYRIIDFKRDKDGVPGKVATIEYDPNRSARICLVHYMDGEKRYILWPVGVKVGDMIQAGDGSDIRPGNAMAIRSMPIGTLIHNIELVPGKGGQLVRTAGGSAQLMGREGKYATIRLSSGEMRMIQVECKATIGQVANLDHENIKHGKAGKKRWLGVYMHNRGVVMSPRDHPHGGGEAKSPIGRKKGPVSATGVRALGFRTRRNKSTQKFIIRRRGK